jgi:hypothetical protein
MKNSTITKEEAAVSLDVFSRTGEMTLPGCSYNTYEAAEMRGTIYTLKTDGKVVDQWGGAAVGYKMTVGESSRNELMKYIRVNRILTPAEKIEQDAENALTNARLKLQYEAERTVATVVASLPSNDQMMIAEACTKYRALSNSNKGKSPALSCVQDLIVSATNQFGSVPNYSFRDFARTFGV